MAKRIVSLCIVSLLIASMTLLVACNITDTDTTDLESLHSLAGEEALLSKGKGGCDPGQGDFYPLALGNSWSYTGERSMLIGDNESYNVSVQEIRTITGTEELFGREYVLEEQFSIISGDIEPDDTITYWSRYRQDRAGLYAADVATNTPPGEILVMIRTPWEKLWQRSIEKLESVDKKAAERVRIAHFNKIAAVNELLGRGNSRALQTGPPGGILPDEIQRLKYPLHPRQEWIIRDTPLFYSVVEKHEVLELPAGRMNGWKIRVYNEFLGNNDIVYLWYGRSGFLGMTVHLETTMDGVYGTVISDENLFLVSYDLEGKGKKDDEKGTGKETKMNGYELTAR